MIGKLLKKEDTKREVARLFYAYDKASNALIEKRNELFPMGSKAKSRINLGFEFTIIGKSLYPDQVNTNWGHIGWRHLEKVDD